MVDCKEIKHGSLAKINGGWKLSPWEMGMGCNRSHRKRKYLWTMNAIAQGPDEICQNNTYTCGLPSAKRLNYIGRAARKGCRVPKESEHLFYTAKLEKECLVYQEKCHHCVIPVCNSNCVPLHTKSAQTSICLQEQRWITPELAQS